MTQHLRNSHRKHRKAIWGLAAVLAVAIAAVVIPIASGTGPKTYTIAVSPSNVCSSATDGGASTVLTLKNTSSPQSFGSAEVYFPPNTVFQVTAPATLRSNTTSTTSGGTKDIVAFELLNVTPGSSVQVTVKFKANAQLNAPVTAVVKQSNRFNDSGGSANLFVLDPAQGSFPTMKVLPCVTVSGRVYHDRNRDFVFTTGDGAFDDSDVPKAWTVKLFAKGVGAASFPATAFKTVTSSSSDGTYAFTDVPTGNDYKVCVAAAGSPDSTSLWGLQSPTGNAQCGPLSTASGASPTSAGNVLPNLSAAAGGQDFLAVPTTPLFGAGDTSTKDGYTVTAGTNAGSKPDQSYVHDAWVDSEGRANFRFSPITPCGPPQDCSKKIYLLETLTSDVTLESLAGRQVSVLYDDVAPFLDGDLKPMPYCSIDPRLSGGALAETGVLPGTDTSCIVSGSQTVVAGGKVHVEYLVYTAFDGGRQVT